ncbi:MAG: hypothetical protein ACK5KM_09545 [Hyphomicrobiaceae bacterium]
MIEATAKRAEKRREGLSGRTASDETLYALLGELRADIQALKAEQASHIQAPPPPPENQLQAMLAELHRDVEAMKGEQVAWSASQKERELQAMLHALRQDINTLNNAQSPNHALVRSGAGSRRMASDQLLKVGIPFGMLAGIVAAFSLLFMSGQLTVGNFSSTQLSGFGSPPIAQRGQYAATPEQLLETANALIGKGDIVFARRVLANAVSQGSAIATVELAKTYDPEFLARLYNPSGVAPDEARALQLYEAASRVGNFDATMRLEQLRKIKTSP